MSRTPGAHHKHPRGYTTNPMSDKERQRIKYYLSQSDNMSIAKACRIFKRTSTTIRAIAKEVRAEQPQVEGPATPARVRNVFALSTRSRNR